MRSSRRASHRARAECPDERALASEIFCCCGHESARNLGSSGLVVDDVSVMSMQRGSSGLVVDDASVMSMRHVQFQSIPVIANASVRPVLASFVDAVVGREIVSTMPSPVSETVGARGRCWAGLVVSAVAVVDRETTSTKPIPGTGTASAKNHRLPVLVVSAAASVVVFADHAKELTRPSPVTASASAATAMQKHCDPGWSCLVVTVSFGFPCFPRFVNASAKYCDLRAWNQPGPVVFVAVDVFCERGASASAKHHHVPCLVSSVGVLHSTSENAVRFLPCLSSLRWASVISSRSCSYYSTWRESATFSLRWENVASSRPCSPYSTWRESAVACPWRCCCDSCSSPWTKRGDDCGYAGDCDCVGASRASWRCT